MGHVIVVFKASPFYGSKADALTTARRHNDTKNNHVKSFILGPVSNRS